MGRLSPKEINKLNIKYRISEKDLSVLDISTTFRDIKYLDFLIYSIYFTSNIEYEDSLTLDRTRIVVKDIIAKSNKIFRNENKEKEDIIVSNGVNFYNKLFSFLSLGANLSIDKVRQLHELLTDKLNVNSNWSPGDFRIFEATIAGKEAEVFFSKPEFIYNEMKLLVEEIDNFITCNYESKEEILDITLKLKLKFIIIHPFGDGNGRLSRGLFQFLLIAKGLPVPVFSTWNRKDYHNAMHIACTTNGNMSIIKKMYLDEIKNYILDKKESNMLDWN